MQVENPSDNKQTDPEGNQNSTNIELLPEIEGFADRLSDITGFSIEELIIQALFANYPELTSQLVEKLQEHKYLSQDSDIPFWFHLAPKHNKQLRHLINKYEGRLDQKDIINRLLLIGWKSLQDGKPSTHD